MATDSSARILDAAAFFSPAGLSRTWGGHLRDAEVVDIGPFHVEPFRVSHSIPDTVEFRADLPEHRATALDRVAQLSTLSAHHQRGCCPA